jgi:hypothetical protein
MHAPENSALNPADRMRIQAQCISGHDQRIEDVTERFPSG